MHALRRSFGGRTGVLKGDDAMNGQHDPERLAAYAIGLLDSEDAQATEAHVAGCHPCRQELTELREIDAALHKVPLEVFLDGPPPGGELVLQRTVRQIRKERRQGHQRFTLVAAAVAALAGVAIGGSVASIVFGSRTASETITAPTTAPGSRTLTGFNPDTGVRMTVMVTPAAGWVRLEATVVGIPAGERCALLVVDRSGQRYPAASWLASPSGEEKGTTLEGAAVVAPPDVAAVAVTNFGGYEFVTART